MKCIAHFSVNAPLSICEQFIDKKKTMVTNGNFFLSDTVMHKYIQVYSPATSTLHPRPRLWTRDPRLLVKLHFRKHLFAKPELITGARLRGQDFATGKNFSFNQCHKRVLRFFSGKVFYKSNRKLFSCVCRT